MSDFGKIIVQIAESYNARIKREASVISLLEQDRGTSEDCFSKAELQIADKIIETVNTNPDVMSRRQQIIGKHAHRAIRRMVKRILFYLDCSYEPEKEGNDFSAIAEQISDIIKKLEQPRNHVCIVNNIEVRHVLEALADFFEKNKRKPDKSTNFLAHDVASEIIEAWKQTGFNPTLTLGNDSAGEKKIHVSGFGVFLDAVEATFEQILKKPEPHQDFFDLRGLKNTIKEIKSGKISL